jgi:hypothetical protein
MNVVSIHSFFPFVCVTIQWPHDFFHQLHSHTSLFRKPFTVHHSVCIYISYKCPLSATSPQMKKNTSSSKHYDSAPDIVLPRSKA